MTDCKTSGCTRAAHTKGWCQAHYQRVIRTGGDQADLPLTGSAKTPEQRFCEKSRINETTGCIEWTAASVTFGYGVIFYKGRQQYAHRVAWQFAHGDIPNGMLVLHKCDNPKCVNVAHLFLGSPKDNMDDMRSKSRQRYTGGPCGDKHYLRKNPALVGGEKNGNAKLTKSAVEDIRKKYESGETQVEIAVQYGVRQCHISRIIRGESWAN